MTLAELRKAFSINQDTLAKNLNVKQAEISKIENRANMAAAGLDASGSQCGHDHRNGTLCSGPV